MPVASAEDTSRDSSLMKSIFLAAGQCGIIGYNSGDHLFAELVRIYEHGDVAASVAALHKVGNQRTHILYHAVAALFLFAVATLSTLILKEANLHVATFLSVAWELRHIIVKVVEVESPLLLIGREKLLYEGMEEEIVELHDSAVRPPVGVFRLAHSGGTMAGECGGHDGGDQRRVGVTEAVDTLLCIADDKVILSTAVAL